MEIFPAIDLRGGQVVRLYQGDYDQETVYAADPCAPWPGTSWLPGQSASTWWTWTAPGTAPWPILKASPPSPARAGCTLRWAAASGMRSASAATWTWAWAAASWAPLP